MPVEIWYWLFDWLTAVTMYVMVWIPVRYMCKDK